MSDLIASIDSNWFQRPSPQVAPELLGCYLVRQWPDGRRLRGRIVEVEAYAPGDPACHAYRRKTPRNAVMFGPAGQSYVYLIYGIYHCLNVVTDGPDVPSAVLIRALELLEIPAWVPLPPKQKPHRIAAGPGKLCRVFEIDRQLNGVSLQTGPPLWLEPSSHDNKGAVVQTTRIGLSQGTEIPWRWYLANSKAVSKA